MIEFPVIYSFTFAFTYTQDNHVIMDGVDPPHPTLQFQIGPT
jgi:hypothetical protein